jgi:phosphoserine phosphatase
MIEGLCWAGLLGAGWMVAMAAQAQPREPDPLPSWNEGASKRAILDFVKRVTTEHGPDYVAPPERIAVFDNDGTLWVEQPVPVQFQFVLERVKQLAPQHPEWRARQPFKAVLDNDMKALIESGHRGLMEIFAATQVGMSADAFDQLARTWLAQSRDARFHRRHDELVYQPMLEVLRLLRANGFKTFIVTGGGAEFVRAFAEPTYGIGPDQVVGSTLVTQLEPREGKPVLIRTPKIDFVDDKAGKPVGIQRHIGRRPIAAFGNSDGDLQMLQWTAAGPGPSLEVLVHHTDAAREYAYDRQAPSPIRLDKALDEAGPRGWTVVDMKADWKAIFPFDAR